MKFFRSLDFTLPTWSVVIFVLSPILSQQEVAAPSFVYLLAIALPTFFYFFSRNRKGLYMQNSHIYALLFFFCYLISTVFSVYSIIDSRISKFFVFVLYFICITSFKYSDLAILSIFRVCIVVSVILAVLIILSYIFGYTHVDSTFFNNRYSIGITGLYKNPNYLASFINIYFFVLLYILLFSKTSKLQKIVIPLLIGLMIYGDYLTGTRASLITVGIVAVASLLRYVYIKHNIRAFILIIIISLLGIMVEAEIERYIDLFLGNRSLTEDEGRIDSWQFAYRVATSNPFWGLGSSSWAGMSGNHYLYLHNIFIELFFSQGLVGILLLILMLFSGFFKTKRKDRFFLLTFMFASGFPLSFQNGLIEVNFWRFIILNNILISYSYYSKNGLVDLLCNSVGGMSQARNGSNNSLLLRNHIRKQ